MNNFKTIRDWAAMRLDEAVKESGLRIDAICEKSGMPYSTLNSKRKGYSPISFEDIATLAPILGYPMSWFVPPQMSSYREVA